jgi:hypothetical protein
MSAQIEIVSVTGSFPVDVYVADTFGNNNTYLGSIPPMTTFPISFILPNIFNLAPAVMVTLIDSTGCDEFQILECVS